MKMVFALMTLVFAPAISYADYYLTPGGAPLQLQNGERVWCGQQQPPAYRFSCICRSTVDKKIALGVMVDSGNVYGPGAGAIQIACANLPYFKYQPATISVNPAECRRDF